MSLTRRFLLVFLPVPLILMGIVFAATHIQVEKAISSAIERNSYIQAHAMGYALSQTLAETRNQIAALAAGSSSLDEMSNRLRRRLQVLIALGDLRFREAAFVSTGTQASEKFLWFTHDGKVLDIPPQQFDSLNNSPFNFKLPRVHDVSLSQPTEVTYIFNSENSNRPELQVSTQVIRFATPVVLTDGTFAGHLILSVDMGILRDSIASFATDMDSKEKPPLVLFVDRNGWMLFQMELNGSREQKPLDRVRSGLRGDFGRAGFGHAFRPKSDHYGYWQMMNGIRANKSGLFSTKDRAWNEGEQIADTVSYAPVVYSSGVDSKQEVLGGIVVLEPEALGAAAEKDLFLVYLGAIALVLLFLALGTVTLCGSVRNALSLLRADILSTRLPKRDEPAEIREVRESVNEVLRQMRTLKDERERKDNLALARVQQEEVLDMPEIATFPEDGLIGVSREINQMRQDIQQAARSQVDVLIMGETGTGKELTSRAVHSLSDRRDGPFITINCGALDEGLLIDTLFGHVKGAYTEAKTSRKGAFLTAEGGTLMLDEIATASPKVQMALLRALSERCIYPLGSDTKIPFNTRVIAATNADLKEECGKGRFREDLYFRLAVIIIRTPPLRQRKMDIPYLIMAFLRQAVEESGSLRPLPGISKGALSQLMHYHWPGNIRELKNVIFRAVAFGKGDRIQPRHLRLGVDDPGHGHEAEKAEADTVLQPDDTESRDQPASPRESDGKLQAESGADTAPQPAPSSSGRQKDLPARLIQLLPKLAEMKEFTRHDYQELAEVSMRTAQYDLQKLQAAGLLIREGKGLAQRYKVAAAEKEQRG